MGGVVSGRTVTLKLHVEALPEPSVAEQATGVVPTGKPEPEAYAQLTGTEPQLSVAEAWNEATAPSVEHVSIVCESGQLTAGGVASTTVMVPTH